MAEKKSNWKKYLGFSLGAVALLALGGTVGVFGNKYIQEKQGIDNALCYPTTITLAPTATANTSSLDLTNHTILASDTATKVNFKITGSAKNATITDWSDIVKISIHFGEKVQNDDKKEVYNTTAEKDFSSCFHVSAIEKDVFDFSASDIPSEVQKNFTNPGITKIYRIMVTSIKDKTVVGEYAFGLTTTAITTTTTGSGA